MMAWAGQATLLAGLLAGVVALACRSRRLSPATRHALWLVVLVKLVMPPMPGWPWSIQPLWQSALRVMSSSPVSGPEVTSAPVLPVARVRVDVGVDPPKIREAASRLTAVPRTAGADAVAADRARSANVGTSRWTSLATSLSTSPWTSRWSWLIGVWLAGALIVLLVQVVRIARVVRVLRGARSAADDLQAQVAAIAQRMHVRMPRICVVPGLETPFVWGVFRPRLAWPDEHALPSRALESVIVHELAHVKRRDHWVGGIELVASCVWWWHPLCWHVRGRLRENAELACDAWVVAMVPHHRRAYAETLIALGAGPRGYRMSALAMGVASRHRRSLERRLELILRGGTARRCSPTMVVLVALLACLIVPVRATRTEPQLASIAPTPLVVEPLTLTDSLVVRAPAQRPPASTPAPRPAPSVVPGSDVNTLIDRFEQQRAAALLEADGKIAKERAALVQQLQAMQDRYTRDAKLDEALAVRERIRRLQSGDSAIQALSGSVVVRMPEFDGERWSYGRVEPDGRTIGFVLAPQPLTENMVRYRGTGDGSYVFGIRGATNGQVAGDGVYTDDSSLATAAVHAGILGPGEFGLVKVSRVPGQAIYRGTHKNGVSSVARASHPASYRLEKTNEPPSVMPRQPGSSWIQDIVGDTSGQVWGNDVYTDDSSLAAAAVHAGIVRPGEVARVRIVLLRGQSSYPGTQRNGVTSSEFGAWPGSFTLERAN